jgi:hypothetical protein
MAHTFEFTDGNKTIDVVYNAATQKNFAMFYGARIQAQATTIQEHHPDRGQSKLVSAVDVDRTVFFEMDVYQGDDDIDIGVLDNLADLKRWLDGADQQALRYHLHGDCDEIFLKVKPDGVTNATLHSCKAGFVDDSGAFYTKYQDLTGNRHANTVIVQVKLTPYGQAENAISLKNMLPGSPHFIEDIDADGIADGWNSHNAEAGELTLNTTNYLVGGQSQKIDVSSLDEGIRSDSAINPASETDYVGYIWVYLVSGAARLYFLDVGASIYRTNTIISAGNADRTMVDSAGNTWWRIVVSGTDLTAGNDARLYIRSDGGAAELYIDAAYLEIGTTVVPDAWCSSMEWENRNDKDYASGGIHYVDLWGIPGDAMALMETKATITDATGSPNRLYLGKTSDGQVLAADQITWIESDEFTSQSGTISVTWSAGTGTSDNHYYRATYSSGTGQGVRTAPKSGDAARQLALTPRRVFGLIRASDVSTAEVRCRVASGTELLLSDWLQLNANNVWELVDFGLMNGAGIITAEVPDSATPTINFQLDCQNLGSGDTLDFDAFLLMPVEEFLITRSISPGPAVTHTFHIRPVYEDVVNDDKGYAEAGTLGSMWYAWPGRRTTRIIMAWELATTSVYTLANSADVSFNITPRTRHLLGLT